MALAERRLAQVEAALTPTQLVLRWLVEAHSHGSLEAYVEASLDDPRQEFPFNRLAREAVGGFRSGSRRRMGEQTDAAVRAALQQTVFRFELVIRINETTHEFLDGEALTDMDTSRCWGTSQRRTASRTASKVGGWPLHGRSPRGGSSRSTRRRKRGRWRKPATSTAIPPSSPTPSGRGRSRSARPSAWL